MKNNILCLFTLSLLSMSIFAADINLAVGDSIIIESNSRAKISCGRTGPGNGPGNQPQPTNPCTVLVKAFTQILESCQENSPPGTCIETNWPKFKAANPKCVPAATPICIETCEQSYPGGTCSEICQ